MYVLYSTLGERIAAADLSKGEIMVTTFAFVGFVIATVTAFRFMIRARTLEDTPTSKARSAEQGYVELEGHAELLDGPPIVSPVSGRECVWWSFAIHRRQGDKYELVHKQTSDSIFALRDSTGFCTVDPEGADVYPTHKRVWRTRAKPPGVRQLNKVRDNEVVRITEYFLMPHEQITVIGMFKTHMALDHWDDTEELSRILREWKRDQPELMSRFDANKDGVLDEHEWEQAREAARKALEAEKREHAVRPGVHVIAAPSDRRPFLIAPFHNQVFAKKMRTKAIWSALGAAVAGIALVVILLKILSV